jgi:MFS-type transporter involved in bile tolerance (Atg22 family)
VGKAVIIMGTGMILTALIDYVTETSYGWIVFGIFFLWGFIVILIAQKKYNGGLF